MCFYFEGNDVGRDGKMTYEEVLAEVRPACLFGMARRLYRTAAARPACHWSTALFVAPCKAAPTPRACALSHQPCTRTARPRVPQVCRVANWLRSVGVKKGDAVAIYMPMGECMHE